MSLLGVSARAGVQGPATGCSLHRDGRGAPPPQPAPVHPWPEAEAPPALERAVDAAFAEPEGGGRNTLAVAVARGGRLLAERYLAPVDAGTRLQGWSMNKSLLATWVALRSADGEGLSLSDPVRQRLLALGAPPATTRDDGSASKEARHHASLVGERPPRYNLFDPEALPEALPQALPQAMTQTVTQKVVQSFNGSWRPEAVPPQRTPARPLALRS